MAFAGDGRKLTGSDGTIFSGELGTEIPGDGVTPLPVGLYVVTKVAASSAFPAPASGGDQIRVGDPLRVRSGTTITPAVDDDVKPLTLTELCDITSFTLPFTADEIETTTFCDDIKTYEPGKDDAAGSLTGITTIGTTTGENGFLRQFIDIITQDGATSYDVFVKTKAVIIAYLVINKNQGKGDELAVLAPINIFGAGVGGDQGAAQSFDSSFRFASFEGVNPVLYRASYT